MAHINIYSGLSVGPAATISSAQSAANVLGALCVGNGVSDGTRILSALDGSMAVGSTRMLSVGQSATARNQGDLAFYLAGIGASTNYLSLGMYNAPQLYVTSTGVGIGTSAPAYKFDVTGDARVSGNLFTGGGAGTVIKGNLPVGTGATPTTANIYQLSTTFGTTLPNTSYICLASMGSTGNVTDSYGVSVTNKRTTGVTFNWYRISQTTNTGLGATNYATLGVYATAGELANLSISYMVTY